MSDQIRKLLWTDGNFRLVWIENLHIRCIEKPYGVTFVEIKSKDAFNEPYWRSITNEENFYFLNSLGDYLYNKEQDV